MTFGCASGTESLAAGTAAPAEPAGGAETAQSAIAAGAADAAEATDGVVRGNGGLVKLKEPDPTYRPPPDPLPPEPP